MKRQVVQQSIFAFTTVTVAVAITAGTFATFHRSHLEEPQQEITVESSTATQETTQIVEDPVETVESSNSRLHIVEDFHIETTHVETTYNETSSAETSVVEGPSYTEQELEILAIIIYQEAGGDHCSDDTRLKVGSVFLNRVASPLFPDTFEEVATQKGQYGTLHWTGIKWSDRSSYEQEAHAVERAYRIAKELLTNGSVLPINVIWQAEFYQGDGLFCYQDNIYFCYSEVIR